MLTVRLLRLIIALIFMLYPTFALVTAQDQESLTPDARVIVMETRLRLREAPTTRSNTVTFIDPSAPLSIIGRTTDSAWLEVRTADGTEGWGDADLIDVFIDLNEVTITSKSTTVTTPDITLSHNVIKRIREIYEVGQQLGNRPDAFSKIGDSITAASHTLNPIGDGLYYLGDFQHLQPVIDRYMENATEDDNAFNHQSLAASIGWSTSALIDPDLANSEHCLEHETPLLCEYRITQPTIALIMVGTNDTGYIPASAYRGNLHAIITATIDLGIIPVLSTIPNRVGYEDTVIEFNDIVVELTEHYAIPLWDYNAAMQDLPANGLDIDGVHPSIPPAGYKGAADFHTHNLYYGYVIRNLTALQMLDAVLQAVTAPE